MLVVRWNSNSLEAIICFGRTIGLGLTSDLLFHFQLSSFVFKMCYVVLVQLSALLLFILLSYPLFVFYCHIFIHLILFSLHLILFSFHLILFRFIHFTTVISCCFTSFHQMVCHSSSLLSQFTHLILSFILYRSTSICLIHSIRSLNASIHWFIRSTKGFILNQIHFIHSFLAFIHSWTRCGPWCVRGIICIFQDYSLHMCTNQNEWLYVDGTRRYLLLVPVSLAILS